MRKYLTPSITAICLICTGMNMAIAQTANPFKNVTGDETSPQPKTVPKAKPKPEGAIRVNGKICRRAVQHVPRDDVAYQAGVDAYGNPVKPADLPGSNFEFDIPDSVSFDLDFNPLKYAGNSNLENLFPNASSSLGVIKYSISSGKLTYNGRPLTNDQNAAIAAACREYASKKKQ